MKTNHLFGLAAVVAVTGFAASAQAGWSLNFSFGAPVLFPTSVVVIAPRCSPPVVYCPQRVKYCPPSVVYAAPQWGPNYGFPDHPCQGHYRGRGAWAHYDHGHSHGGQRLYPRRSIHPEGHQLLRAFLFQHHSCLYGCPPFGRVIRRETAQMGCCQRSPSS